MAFNKKKSMDLNVFTDVKFMIPTGIPRNVGVFPVGTHGSGTKSLHSIWAVALQSLHF